MLGNISSLFFLRNLFSVINIRRYLKIISYNKNLQKTLNVNINDFKRITGKYIIGGINGYGKEYDSKDSLLFEGEYLKGKRNGTGREYGKYGEVKFEGEYLNGMRHGKGKEYNSEGRLIFEGEYLNGEKNGKGKEYNCFTGKIRFEGEYLNGKEWNGKSYNGNNEIECEVKNGNGYIKKYNDGGELKSEGFYVNGKKNGKVIKYHWSNKKKI